MFLNQPTLNYLLKKGCLSLARACLPLKKSFYRELVLLNIVENNTKNMNLLSTMCFQTGCRMFTCLSSGILSRKQNQLWFLIF